MDYTRKQFCGALGAGVVTLWLTGCGGGDEDPPAPTPGNPVVAVIADNHGHALSIPAADLDSTTARTYSIEGAAGHRHDVTVTAAQLQRLKSGGAVALTSTTTLGHDHGLSLG